VVWDGARQHSGASSARFFAAHERVREVRLPRYSPDFNPQEGIWGAAKGEGLANYAAPDGPTLLRKVRSVLHSLQRRPERLIGCLKGSGLPWRTLLNPRTGR
jgi:transposase